VALIRTDVSEDRIASIFRVHECELVTERSCKLLYSHRLVGDWCTLKMEAIRSSETSVLIRATRCNFLEDDNHHIHRLGNLKSYKPNHVTIIIASTSFLKLLLNDGVSIEILQRRYCSCTYMFRLIALAGRAIAQAVSRRLPTAAAARF
jgi:hypothetical protein